MNDAQIAQIRSILYGEYPDAEKIGRLKSAIACYHESPVHSVVHETASRYGVTATELMNMKCRHRTVVAARWEAWAVLRNEKRMTAIAIAHEFGTSHSTVVSGIGHHGRRMRRM